MFKDRRYGTQERRVKGGMMNLNQPNPSAGSSAATARARQTAQTELSASDLHLAELLRSLRALAADSPERQAKIEGLMHAYASGTLQVNAEATASAMIDDAFSPRFTLR
jgi:anti-sigma28 factor (negative regulator of flagellin synthesis)